MTVEYTLTVTVTRELEPDDTDTAWHLSSKVKREIERELLSRLSYHDKDTMYDAEVIDAELKG